MNRIQEVFRNKKAFIPFITAGDPDLKVTEELVAAMAEAGADLIELGIPFSDPVAEGIVIQEADMRALLPAPPRIRFLTASGGYGRRQMCRWRS